MKLKILGCGTSTGVPVPGCRCKVCISDHPRNKRLRTSAVICLDSGERILIDSTPDLRQQVLSQDIRRIDAVLYTHTHSDHIMGLDDLKCFNFVSGKAIPCYGTAFTLSEIKRVFAYTFQDPASYEGGMLTQLTLNEINYNQSFELCGLTITPFLLHHGKTKVTGYRVGDLAYATDCNLIPDESLSVISGVKTLILDGLRYQEHKTHFTIPESLDVARKIGADKTYLVHMTHTVDYVEELSKLPNNVELAYDGLEIELI